jgi:hypothetical protein
MSETPKRRWWNAEFQGSTVVDWFGLLLIFIGILGVEVATDYAVRHRLIWMPLAYATILPIFGVGCLILLWSARRKRSGS